MIKWSSGMVALLSGSSVYSLLGGLLNELEKMLIKRTDGIHKATFCWLQCFLHHNQTMEQEFNQKGNLPAVRRYQ